MITVRLSDELHDKFKAVCAEKGITMQALLLDYIKRFVSDRSKT